MRVILLIIIGLNVLNAEITRDLNGIVTDTSTKLQWQDDVMGSYMPWGAAINYCESSTLGGHSDWRLANINELKSIIDRSNHNPAIVDGFVNMTSRTWSSTTFGGDKSHAFYLLPDSGSTDEGRKDLNSYARCVRDVQ